MSTSETSISIFTTLHMLTETHDFGCQLFDLLTPMGLSAFLDALEIKITAAQSKRYMSLWRQFFTERSWISSMASRGLELYLVGNDLATLMNWIRHPKLLNNSRRKLYPDLRLTARTSLHAQSQLSIDNCDCVIRETYELLDEFIVKSDTDSWPTIPAFSCERGSSRATPRWNHGWSSPPQARLSTHIGLRRLEQRVLNVLPTCLSVCGTAKRACKGGASAADSSVSRQACY